MTIDTQSLTEDELARLNEMSEKYQDHYSQDESDRMAYEQLFGESEKND